MRLRRYIAAVAVPVVFLAALATDVPARGGLLDRTQNGDSQRGRTLYENRCIACHSLDASRVGPKHRGVFGRRAGRAEGYAYSPALRQSEIVWGAETLDLWLANPEAMIPGQRMNVRVADAADRADIIAYLEREIGRTSRLGQQDIDHVADPDHSRGGM